MITTKCRGERDRRIGNVFSHVFTFNSFHSHKLHIREPEFHTPQTGSHRARTHSPRGGQQFGSTQRRGPFGRPRPPSVHSRAGRLGAPQTSLVHTLATSHLANSTTCPTFSSDICPLFISIVLNRPSRELSPLLTLQLTVEPFLRPPP